MDLDVLHVGSNGVLLEFGQNKSTESVEPTLMVLVLSFRVEFETRSCCVKFIIPVSNSRHLSSNTVWHTLTHTHKVVVNFKCFSKSTINEQVIKSKCEVIKSKCGDGEQKMRQSRVHCVLGPDCLAKHRAVCPEVLSAGSQFPAGHVVDCPIPGYTTTGYQLQLLIYSVLYS